MAGIVVRFDDPKDDAETFKVDNQQFLTEIGGAVTELDEVDGQYMGLIKFTPNGWKTFSNFWKEIEESDFSNVQVTQVLRQLVAKKSGYVKAIPYEGEWGELDLESDLEHKKTIEEAINSLDGKIEIKYYHCRFYWKKFWGEKQSAAGSAKSLRFF